jgi:D-alanyl-D-alanine carboxypeptidase/D-alanyl-D-alanine-endopeptidase (penicillin-binding protein 4)
MFSMRRSMVLLAAAICLLSSAQAASARTPQTKLRTYLTRELRNAGGHSGALVLDLQTGKTLFSWAARTPMLPASVEKLYTTTTALQRFGSAATLSTKVFGSGSLDSAGRFRGTLYLKGGGDPTFGSAAYDRYAYGTGATVEQLVSNLVHATGMSAFHGRIVGDGSYFDSLRGTPATGFQPNLYVEGQLSGLVFNRGFADASASTFQPRPALFAAQQFAAALRGGGVRVGTKAIIYTAHTPASAQLLAQVRSPTIATLIRLTNAPSDNFFAEMLLKDIGAAFGGKGTTAAGAAVVRAQMASSFGIHPRLDDGSGLSRDDFTTPRQVVTLLRAMAGNSVFLNSLAVAGRSGTMQYEMRGTRAAGRCQGKTGSLHDVANLVGYCTARNGHRLAFAFLMNSLSDELAGHAIEDQMAEALARYDG